MRILVCGGRDFADSALLTETLDAIHVETPIEIVIHGATPGADTLARNWAWRRGVYEDGYSARWSESGRAAGPLRNARMLAEGKPDLVLAFPGGRGTEDMVRKAEAAGVRVQRVARTGVPRG